MKRLTAPLWLAVSLIVPFVAAQETERSVDYTMDEKTLRQGARIFADRCLPCHTLRYLRYGRVADDLNLGKAQVHAMLMLPDQAQWDQGMTNTLDPADAKRWFGVAPPDLTLTAQVRGADWIATYLRSFYLDPSRPGGWNNHLFPNAGMPNVLVDLSGETDARGDALAGRTMNAKEFDRTIAALTAWLHYASDPSVITRRRLGPYVIAFVAFFALLLFLLERSYWKEVGKEREGADK